MEVHRIFQPDSRGENLVWALSGILGLWAFLELKISILVLILYLVVLTILWLTKRASSRVEISKDGIEGAGLHGPSHRVFIPWDQADVHINLRNGSLRLISVKDVRGHHQIKITRSHFSNNSLKLLEKMIRHHHPHLSEG